MDFRRRKGCVEKPTNFHIIIVFLKAFWEVHQMVIMAPDNITLLIVLIHHISKHLVCLLICSKLRLETSGRGKSIFLWKPKVMKEGPQYIVAVAIIILMNNLFVKEYRNTPLQ
jgi:hypothetical protein